MTQDLVRRLIEAGLSKQQATSATAETLVRLFMPEDGKMLIQEAKLQVDEMRATVKRLQDDYEALQRKMNESIDVINTLAEVQKEFGAITEDKARNAIALYGSLISMGMKAGADGHESVESASYIMYAYLGGQAKRDVTYTDGEWQGRWNRGE